MKHHDKLEIAREGLQASSSNIQEALQRLIKGEPYKGFKEAYKSLLAGYVAIACNYAKSFDHQYQEISKERASEILKKWELADANIETWTDEELTNFIVKEDRGYTAISNEDGWCWCEDFKLYESCILYLLTDIPTSDIYQLEEILLDLDY